MKLGVNKWKILYHVHKRKTMSIMEIAEASGLTYNYLCNKLKKMSQYLDSAMYFDFDNQKEIKKYTWRYEK